MLNLVLLPGWGINADSLKPLADALQQMLPNTQLHLIELPIFEQPNLTLALAQLVEKIPRNPWLIGWSLGGMLAMQLTQQVPVAGVITIASNACFTQRPDWPCAMTQASFDVFQQACETQLASTLKRFNLLCSQGAENPRQIAKQLLPFTQTPEQANHGLSVLQQIDNRLALTQLRLPQLHIFAEQDALVPICCAASIRQLSPTVHISWMQGSHALVVEKPIDLAKKIGRFVQEFKHAE